MRGYVQPPDTILPITPMTLLTKPLLKDTNQKPEKLEELYTLIVSLDRNIIRIREFITEEMKIIQSTINTNIANQVKIATSYLSNKTGAPTLTNTNTNTLESTLDKIQTLNSHVDLITVGNPNDKTELEARIASLYGSTKILDTYLKIDYINIYIDDFATDYITIVFHNDTTNTLSRQ